MKVPLGAGDRPAADQQARSLDVPAPQPLLEQEGHHVPSPVVAQRGDAGVQVPTQVRHPCQRQDPVCLGEELDIRAAICSQADVGVRVDQTGGDTGITQVDELDVAGCLLPNLCQCPDRLDAVALHQHGLVRPDPGAQSVEQPVGPNDQLRSCGI